MVIAGGVGEPKTGTSLVLAMPPFIYVGNISYSLYLWHWPVLIVTAAYFGRDLSVTTNVGLLAVAFALSAASYRLIEQPMQRSETLRDNRSLSLFFWPVAITAVLLVGVLMRDSVHVSAISAETPARTAAPVAPAGATLSGDPFVAAVQGAVSAAQAGSLIPTGLSPAPSALEDDVDYLAQCTASAGETTNESCEFGDTSASRSIVVMGDSHALMWMPALTRIGQDRGYKIVPLIKHACAASTVTVWDETNGPREDCNAWRGWAENRARDLAPERILVSTRLVDWVWVDGKNVAPTPNAWRDGTATTVRELGSTGIPVSVLSDAPGVATNPTECILGRDATMASCTSPVSQKVSQLNPAMKTGTESSGGTYVELTDLFCAEGMCPAVVGNTIAYRDESHVTRTYALALTQPLADRLFLG